MHDPTEEKIAPRVIQMDVALRAKHNLKLSLESNKDRRSWDDAQLLSAIQESPQARWAFAHARTQAPQDLPGLSTHLFYLCSNAARGDRRFRHERTTHSRFGCRQRPRSLRSAMEEFDMKRTKKAKPQVILALPLDPGTPNAEPEAVRMAGASFPAAPTQPTAGSGRESPNVTPSPVEPAPAPATEEPEYVDAPLSGRNTLYIVTAVQWGLVPVKRGTREGWQRLPDVGFKGKAQALIAAERMVEAGRATGALAIRQTADIDAGEYDEPVVLARFGQMPEGMAEL